MKKCVIVVNTLSGNSSIISEETMIELFGDQFDTEILKIVEDTVLPDFYDYARIVVCGGDGTLHNILNSHLNPEAELIYCPSGTLNELATGNSKQKDYILHDVAKANEHMFSYVCACGTFTSLGYETKNKHKRVFKSMAYLWNVIKTYKIHEISAQIDMDGKTEQGVYSLIMIVDSPQCFGFRFNKMYKLDDGKLHVLAIKAPRHKNVFGRLKLFFPLFRAFFGGFKRNYQSKKMFFREVKNVTLTLQENINFCMDGELVTLSGTVNIRPTQLPTPIHVVTTQAVGEYVKKLSGITF